MASLINIRKRIHTVHTTSKITQAMKLVATAKIQQQKNEFMRVNGFITELYDIIANLTKSVSYNELFKDKTSKKNLYIVISSSLGLCGAFNINISKFATNQIKSDDEIIVIGSKGYSYLKNKGYYSKIVQNIEVSAGNINYLELFPVTQFIVENFNKEYYNKVFIVYTKYQNSLNFEPTIVQILPFDNALFTNIEKSANKVEKHTELLDGKIIEFDPNKKDILTQTIPFFTSCILVCAITESRLCEFSSRRNAMEKASDNAKELIANLKLEYNRIRQEKITQEINEIVAGSQ